MLQAVIGSTMNRTTVIVPETTTLDEAINMATASGIALEQNETFTLNGVSLRRSRGDLGRTFADYGVTGRATLVSVKDSQNA